MAPITDDREHMIMRAICDERISLPLEAFKEHPEIYDQIVAILPADQLMDVKVAWRCNTTQYWHAEVDAAPAGPLYAKLGYSAAAIEAMDFNPFGGHVNLTAQGAKLLGEEPAHSGHPNPGARQSGHSPEQRGLRLRQGLHEEELPWRQAPCLLGAHGMWLGFEQCQPLGNGPKREGCDTWRLLLQMVQGLLEGKDGELPLSSDHLGQCGPSDGLG